MNEPLNVLARSGRIDPLCSPMRQNSIYRMAPTTSKGSLKQNTKTEYLPLFGYHWQWRFLAHLVMSPCNHALSVVCRCRCRHRWHHWHHCHWHWHWHMCTALPVIGLIIEALYLINICSYASSICT